MIHVGKEAIMARAVEVETILEAVRELHRPVANSGRWHLDRERVWHRIAECTACLEWTYEEGDSWTDWPCATAKIVYTEEEINAARPH